MMGSLPSELPWWIAAAVLLFWFVGAYNRLVRLRSAALQAYAALDAALMRQLDFVQARTREVDQQLAAGLDAIVQLRATALQLTTLLASTRQRPLDPERIAALGTALHVMLAAWQRLYPDEVVSFEADGTLSRPVPLGGVPDEAAVSSAVAIAWPEPSAAAEISRGQFNQAVRLYNSAASQFPALLVAWVMQLKRAAELH